MSKWQGWPLWFCGAEFKLWVYCHVNVSCLSYCHRCNSSYNWRLLFYSYYTNIVFYVLFAMNSFSLTFFLKYRPSTQAFFNLGSAEPGGSPNHLLGSLEILNLALFWVSRGQFHIRLRAAFTHADPESTKMTVKLSIFLRFWDLSA